ncbi:MAG: Programmed cell death toxin MazF like [uncultured Cytophagales bacterium]|uniref:Programmed cell death toxin MazF like n=1 Tax=uncultured Cytophagales bacterium TaxID=158755 RepID=A0A6J4HMU7_9SPHI|nr:MAG: Programmed cell death toxin MazF like [uncultured Cytophagales bacterium]
MLQSVLSAGTEVVISAQVLNEFSNVASRKLAYSAFQVSAQLHAFPDAFTVVPLLPAYTLQAIALKDRYGYAYYDSLIVATALQTGCTHLYSEDMHHGQKVDGLTIINPFL